TYIMGSSRNLGGPVVSVGEPVLEAGKQSRGRGGCALHRGSETQAEGREREAEENKRRGKGRQEVGGLYRNDETGGTTQRDPWREGSTGARNSSREIWRRHRAPQPYQRNSSR